MRKSKQLFVLQNQDKYFLSKQNEWVDGTDVKDLFKTPHRDVAVNHLFEVNAHDYSQRIHVLDCEVESNNQPVIGPDLMPPPLPKKVKPEADAESQDGTVALDPNTPMEAEPAEMETPTTEPVMNAETPVAEPSGAVEPEEELLVHEV